MAAADDLRSSGSAARETRTMPSTLTSKTRAHSASSLSSTVPWAPMPALLTTMSMPPSASAAAATASRIDGSSVTSAWKPSSGFSTSGCRSRQATWAPRSRSSVAVARPMPEAPPVTIAVRPANSGMGQTSREWALPPRVDMDLGPGAARAMVAGEHAGDLVEAHGRGDDRPRVDRAVRVRLDGARQPGRRAEDADRGDVLEHQGAGVDQARRHRQPDVDDPAARLDQVEGERRHLRPGR